MTTAQRRLVPGEPGVGGYRRLVQADGEQHRIRSELSGVGLRPGWQRSARPMLRIAVGIIGCYRAQELFTYQVADAMARAVRKVASGPVSGAPVEFAIVTGD